jgi:hypothetical protein
VRMKLPGSVAFVVCFVLLSAAPIHAEWPSIQAPAGPSSGIVKKFLNGLRRPDAQHHRTASSPPLPRPRPSDLPREAAELNKAAPEVVPSSESNRYPAAGTSAEASKTPEGGPAPTSNQTSDASSPSINAANAPAEVTASVQANEPPAAELAGSNKTTPALPPALSAKPNEAEARAPIND